MGAHHLPIQVTSFVGRTQELAEIAALLADPACRLLTLVGPGGMGKTRLAIELAAAQASLYPDGIYFVALQPLSSPDLIVPTIAESLGIQFYGQTDPKQQLLDYLSSKSLLLVLDNLEHLLDGVSLVGEMLITAPHLKLLVTSREILNLQEEWLYHVKGMHFPHGELIRPMEDYSAVRLFVQSARRAQPDFTLANEQIWVTRICELVEGMPLGIELAAAWLKRLPCREVALEIERGLDILETSARNVPERHRSMRAVMDYSWHLLSESEQAVFMKLSVFRGGFMREAAEAIADATLWSLSSLMDKSLLRVDVNGRYDLHELVRQYAAEQLEASPEAESVRDAHCAYYADLMYQREQDVFGNRQQEGLEKIEAEIDNVRTAFRRAMEEVNLQEIGKIADGLWLFYEIRCWFQESEQTFRQAVEAIQARSYEVQTERNRVLGLCLAVHGWSLILLRQFDLAQRVLHQGLALLRSLPIGKELHRAVGALGELPISYAERTQWSEEALLIARAIGFHWGIAASLSVLSEIAHKQGHYAEARRGCEEALLIFRELDNQYGVSSVLRQLSYLAFREGQFSQARHLAQKALSTATAINFPRGCLRAQRLLGRAYHAEGNYIQAKHHYAESITMARAIGFGSHLPVTLALYGLSTSASGEFQEAWQHFQQGLKLAAQTRGFSDWQVILVIVAEFLTKIGKLELAAEVSTFVLSDPASSAETREQAEKLLAELKPKLPPEIFMSEADKEVTVEQTVEKLLAITLWSETAISHTKQSLPNDLSERESEILRLVADGLSNREIAERLFLSMGTVKWHLNQINSKLGADSRTHAVALARGLKLLP